MKWAVEKLRHADFVAVGVNIAVATLLIGGLVGAILANDSDASALDPHVEAAVVVPEDVESNETVSSEEPPSSDQRDDEDSKQPDGRRDP